MAQTISDKDPEDVCTFGFDDTTKAAGKQLFDVKITHITVSGPSKSRQTFTTGFTPNASHLSGKDQAQNLKNSLNILAILANRNGDSIDDPYTVEDVQNQS